MRTIIAGGRDITDEHLVYGAIVKSGFMYEITEVVCGGATGVDDLGDKFAFEVGLPVRYFVVTDGGHFKDLDRLRNKRMGASLGAEGNKPLYENIVPAADWHPQRDGLSAGPKRNSKMSRYADALILVWDGASKGSKNMLHTAQGDGLRIYEERINGQEEGAERRHTDVAEHEDAAHQAAPQQADAVATRQDRPADTQRAAAT